MRRPIYLHFLAVLLLSVLAIFPIACSKTYTFSPTSATPNNTPTPALTAYVTTLAGSGAYAANNGTGTSASFDYPTGVVVDSAGNVYVADYGNNLIRKITSTGVVTTFAGSGAAGAVNGTGTAASFNRPVAIAIDTSGNLYVADASNNMIREITPGGVVTTFFNGIGYPQGVAVDNFGNVYVTAPNGIGEITPGGVFTGIAGSGTAGNSNGTGGAASFDNPEGLALDSSGNIYIADRSNNLIRKITSGGVVTTLAGSGAAGSANGIGTAASFNWPDGITLDSSGNVYVSDEDGDLLREITPGGVVTTIAGIGSGGNTNGPALSASFAGPWGLAIDSLGNIYIADEDDNLIRKYVP